MKPGRREEKVPPIKYSSASFGEVEELPAFRFTRAAVAVDWISTQELFVGPAEPVVLGLSEPGAAVVVELASDRLQMAEHATGCIRAPRRIGFDDRAGISMLHGRGRGTQRES